MKQRKYNRRISIVLISIILFWNVLPIMSVSASFITPGQPITPGESITPGEPITGGEFITPGEVYEYGESYNDGSAPESGDSFNSGEPIIEGNPGTFGQFITPNAPPTFSTIVGGNAIQPGNNVQSGNQIDAGNTGAGGTAVEQGQFGSDGTNVEGGQALNGGNSGNAGNVDENGNPINGGNSDANGNAVGGNNADSNGNIINGGNVDGSGEGLAGGDAANGNAIEGSGLTSNGNATQGNGIQGGNGANSDAGKPPSLWNIIFNSTKDSDNFIDTAVSIAKDAKKYVLGFADDVAQGLIATYAGFDFRQLADGNYAVYGKESLNSSIGNWFYERYKSYDYSGSNAEFGPKVRRVGEARYNAFMESKKIGGSGGMMGTVANATKSSLNSSWNVASSSFWKPSNMMKLGGPVGVGLTSVGSVSKHSDGFSDFSGLASTDFAASLTTDVGIGIASTAVGSVASSAAAGAVAGSVVPGLGTIIGAGFGLFAGIATTTLINGTATGRRLKSTVTKTVKKGYDGIVNGAKAIKDGTLSGFSKLGSLFGG
ncbi:autotransporter outer membrane beta-barrel domain-containing protein [Oceanobacillus salinisoli]|uniref:hypothetical protein n=1 Tax=Oceanobacillus salinisoli TaxID=2678611 RepID=UPI0012E2F736|nr:hypothetical protein [Oceanobacillus salinisoli]